MNRRNKKAERAYTNIEFLRSPDARTLRMLAEFLEPQRRFRQHGIKNTIVFFGSARLREREETLKRYRQVREKLKDQRAASKKLLEAFEKAKLDYEFSRYYEDARRLARMLTKWSMSLDDTHRFAICSGGGPGIMEAANRGALKAGGRSIGLNITLPMEQYSNAYISPGLDFQFHYFFMRKLWFVYLAKALVVFPGGFGTMDELMEVLTLVQTRKVTKPMALVIYGKKYWEEILNMKALVRYGMISRKDMNLFQIVDTPEEAFEYLKRTLLRNGC